jgi:uncharacterized protein
LQVEDPREVSVDLRPLNDDDLTRLDVALMQLPQRQSMNAESLDGFITALACGPDDLSSNQFVRRIIGRVRLFVSSEFAVPDYLRDLIFLAVRLRDARLTALQSGQAIIPLLRTDRRDGFVGKDWTRGFVREIESNKEAWRPLMEDCRLGGCIAPIFALAHETDPDCDLRLFDTPLTGAECRKLIACIGPSVSTIYRFHDRQRMYSNEYARVCGSA